MLPGKKNKAYSFRFKFIFKRCKDAKGMSDICPWGEWPRDHIVAEKNPSSLDSQFILLKFSQSKGSRFSFGRPWKREDGVPTYIVLFFNSFESIHFGNTSHI